ncbi:MAG: ABC transporter ATP-binding protein [Rhodobacteraceae bacterium]|nr:ABC transporter ATP-binding protein [Paracoccaceae bacterium]
MIEFRNLQKSYPVRGGGRKVLFDGLTLTLPRGAKVGLLGRNGAGKSTLISMIAGTTKLNGGEIRREGTVSWPLGFAGSFAVDMSGIQNIRFVARIYGVDSDALVDYVADFSELGDFMRMPVRSYSAGMRARLAFGVSMGLSFDWYLVDEITAVGDAAFRKKSLAVFGDRLQASGLIMVSHSSVTLREYCTSGMVIDNGKAIYFDDLEEAIALHEYNMA